VKLKKQGTWMVVWDSCSCPPGDLCDEILDFTCIQVATAILVQPFCDFFQLQGFVMSNMEQGAGEDVNSGICVYSDVETCHLSGGFFVFAPPSGMNSDFAPPHSLQILVFDGNLALQFGVKHLFILSGLLCVPLGGGGIGAVPPLAPPRAAEDIVAY